jgi:peptidoglycan/xylan/chitin deacetylase (PgdA/CDA1 family)
MYKYHNILKVFSLITLLAILFLFFLPNTLQAQETYEETIITVYLDNSGGIEFNNGDIWSVIFNGSVYYSCLCGGISEESSEDIYYELVLEVIDNGSAMRAIDFVYPINSCSIETDEQGDFIITAAVEFGEDISVSSHSMEGATITPLTAQGNWDIEGTYSDAYGYCSCMVDASGNWFAYEQGSLPTPIATFSPSNPSAGEEVIFDGSDSFDLDGEIVKYEWDFGDGNTAEGVEVSNIYDLEGEYIATLTVTDNYELENSTELVVYVGQGFQLIINHAKTDKDKYSLFDEVNLSCEVLNNIWEKVSDVSVNAEVVIPDDTPDDLLDNPKEIIHLIESETVKGFYKCEEPFTNTAQAGKYFVTFNAEKEDYINAEPVELDFIVPVQIVLTFDDGPDSKHPLGSGINTTESIIDDLSFNDIQNEIKAAFFVQTHDPEYGGSLIGETLMEIEDEAGHIIGVHTGGEGEHWFWQSHIFRVEQDAYDVNGDGVADGENALESDMVAAILRIKAITGEVPEFVRPPYWWYNQDVLDAYKSEAVKHALGDDYGEGLKMIYRDVLSGDGGESWISFEWWVKLNIKSEVIDCIEESKTYQMIVSFHDTNEDTVEYLSNPGISNSYLGTIVEGVREGFRLETQEEALEYTQFIISTDGVLHVLRLKEVTEVI